MNNNSEKNQMIIQRDVYCPYCEQNGAFLISEMSGSSTEIKLPELGCKDAILLGCTCGFWAFVKGYSLIRKNDRYEYTTYGFCPHCGNVYNASAAAPPEE